MYTGHLICVCRWCGRRIQKFRKRVFCVYVLADLLPCCCGLSLLCYMFIPPPNHVSFLPLGGCFVCSIFTTACTFAHHAFSIPRIARFRTRTTIYQFLRAEVGRQVFRLYYMYKYYTWSVGKQGHSASARQTMETKQKKAKNQATKLYTCWTNLNEALNLNLQNRPRNDNNRISSNNKRRQLNKHNTTTIRESYNCVCMI